MVIRVEQCAKFEAISSIMHGTPPIWPVSPIQNWTRVTHWTPKDPTAARITGSLFGTTLQWRHNERDGVPNHRRLELFTQPFVQAKIKENTKTPRHWSVWGEFTGDWWIPRSHRWIPRTKASDMKHVSIWWRPHENRKYRCSREMSAPPWNVKWVLPRRNVF